MRFGEAKFQNFPGEHAPGPPGVLAPISAEPTLISLRWIRLL